MTESYLLCDCTGTFNELSFGEAVWGSDLQRSGLLDKEDAAMSKLLHSGLYLEPNLNDRQHQRRYIYWVIFFSVSIQAQGLVTWCKDKHLSHRINRTNQTMLHNYASRMDAPPRHSLCTRFILCIRSSTCLKSYHVRHGFVMGESVCVRAWPKPPSPLLAQLCEQPVVPEQPAGCSPQSPERPGPPAHLGRSPIWSSETHSVVVQTWTKHAHMFTSLHWDVCYNQETSDSCSHT